MRAAVLKQLNSDLAILENIQIPELKNGQVLVKIAYSGICHSQLMEVRGLRGEDKYLPHLLGHEGTGTVAAVGPGVTKVKSGDKVVLSWIKGKGIEAGGSVYAHAAMSKINAGGVTTLSDWSVVSENRVTPLPDGVPMDIGALFGCAVLTGAGIVKNALQPKPGSSIVLLGLGGIGMSALMATHLFECKTIIAADINDSKLALAKELGATHTVNTSREDLFKTVMEITKNTGADYGFEAAGRKDTIELAFACVKRFGGKLVFASHPEQGAKIEIDPYDLICGKQILGSWGGSSNPDEDIPAFAKLYLAGKLPLEKLMDRRYTLDEVNLALNSMENNQAMRPIVSLDETQEGGGKHGQ